MEFSYEPYKEGIPSRVYTGRYYVDWSSWFDMNPYDIEKIKKAVKKGGGSNIRLSNNYGWRNQPKVVTFTANNTDIYRIKKQLQDALGTQWIIIQEKEW